MIKQRHITTILMVILFGELISAQPLVFVAKELNSHSIRKVLASQESEAPTVLFRQGDMIQLHLDIQGDLFLLSEKKAQNIIVQKTFWLKLKDDNLVMSFDGVEFKPISEVIHGKVAIGSNVEKSGDPVSSIDVLFDAYLK